MTDREKVIKGLECCNNDECDSCPYFRSCDENDLGTCRATLHRDALALLKAQEPVYPTWEQVIAEMYLRSGRTKYHNIIEWEINERIPADLAQKLGIEPKNG